MAKAPFITIGSGMSRYGNGAMTVRAILPALLGTYEKPGGGCFVGTTTGEAFAMDLLLRQDFISGLPLECGSYRRALCHALGQDRNPHR